ncbi:CsgG/HfaB family protein [candidate division CSSED10-310 bacterium]|uniref:CsgG/HfaB family protein n=1 Tax=candidate division CSSED10-310 bacterium TaxID=2855610 RepID=A0ABV6Z1N0_UNCC1
MRVKRIHTITYSRLITLCALAIGVIVFAGCGAGKVETPALAGSPVRAVPPPPTEKELVALVGFENKSTYSADKLWETSAEMLMSELIRMSYFRVVEWEKMKSLFDREALRTCSLIKDPDKRNQARGILLCQYFLSGALTRFDVVQQSQVSAISKAKTFETNVRVDLLLQDARSGEYLSQGRGEAKAVKTYKGSIGGGQAGTWDPASANEALELALSSALSQLIDSYANSRGRK